MADRGPEAGATFACWCGRTIRASGDPRLGLLTLHNIPQFMQSIKLPRLDSAMALYAIRALLLLRRVSRPPDS